jgi:hypothetical protein
MKFTKDSVRPPKKKPAAKAPPFTKKAASSEKAEEAKNKKAAKPVDSTILKDAMMDHVRRQMKGSRG